MMILLRRLPVSRLMTIDADRFSHEHVSSFCCA
jgi:hypothetical protein